MNETIESTTGSAGVSRRTIIKGAAWSAPVIAIAVAAPAASASAGFDLYPEFASALTLDIKTLNVTIATVSLFGSLIIHNQGGSPSPAGATVLLTYDNAIVDINATGAGVVVSGSQGNLTFTLPAIPAGGALTINLSPTLLQSGVLALGVGAHALTMTAVISDPGDTKTSNNTATGTIGITVFPPT